MERIDSPLIDEAMARRGRSCAMQSHFFLPGIAPDVARIVHAFAARFLEPCVQFILVLIESVATQDIAPRKRNWGRLHAMLEDDSVGQVDDGVPIPEGGEGIGRFKHPCWASEPIAVTQELDRGRAKGGPMAGMLSVPLRLFQWLTDEGGAVVPGIIIPGVLEVPQSRPGVFPSTDVLICPCHSVKRFWHHGSRSLSDPNSMSSEDAMVSASSCCASGST